MSICTGGVVPFWLHMNLLLVIVLVACSSRPGIADVFPLLPPRLSIFMLTSVQYPQLLWMLTYNIHMVIWFIMILQLSIHTFSYMHAYVYLPNYYVHTSIDVVWMIGIQRGSRTHPFWNDGKRRSSRAAARGCSLASCWSGMAAMCPVEHVIWWLNSLGR